MRNKTNFFPPQKWAGKSREPSHPNRYSHVPQAHVFFTAPTCAGSVRSSLHPALSSNISTNRHTETLYQSHPPFVTYRMALSSCSVRVGTISIHSTRQRRSCLPTLLKTHSARPSFRVLAASSPPKARFVAKRSESTSVKQRQRPLGKFPEYPIF